MATKSRISINSYLSLLQTAFAIAVMLLVFRLIIKHESIEIVGLWSLTAGYVSIVRMLDVSGANGVARMVASTSDEHRQSTYIDTIFSLTCVFYVIASIVLCVPLRHFVVSQVDPEYAEIATMLLTIALISLPLGVGSNVLSFAIDGSGRADIRAIINIMGFCLYFFLFYYLLPVYGILGVALAQIVQFVFVLILSRLFLLFTFSPVKFFPRNFEVSAAKEALSYGFRLQATTLPMGMLDPLARIFINSYAGLGGLGYYDLAYRVAGNVRTLIQAFLNPYVPEFTKVLQENIMLAKELYAKVNKINGRICLVLFFLPIVFSPAISLFFFDSIDRQFLMTLATLCLGWGISTYTLPTQLFSRAMGVLRWSMIGQWTMLAALLPLILGAVHFFGDKWIAIGVSTSLVLGHWFAYYLEVLNLDLGPARSRWFRLFQSTIILVLSGGLIHAIALFTSWWLD